GGGGDGLALDPTRNTHVRSPAPLAGASSLAPTLPGWPSAAAPPTLDAPMPAPGTTGGPPGPVRLPRLDPGRRGRRLAARRRRPCQPPHRPPLHRLPPH